tara:strand:+ start:10912 stop:11457 length:546 start_codon:yes stop_codon:yes gene_type:complete
MTTTPRRIQRKRTPGWVSPDNTVYVGRPTVFGNPFDWKEVGRAKAVAMYRDWLAGKLDDHFPDLVERRQAILERLPELRGRNQSCWCPLEAPCHADVLLPLANQDMSEITTKMQSKSSHGGRRPGAGRKPQGERPKERKTYTLAPDVVERINALSDETGHSKAAVIEYAVRSLKKLPHNLE